MSEGNQNFMSLPMQRVNVAAEDDDGKEIQVLCRAFAITPNLATIAIIDEEGHIDKVPAESVTFRAAK